MPLAGIACAGLALCSCGLRDYDNENDRLRRVTLEQSDRIKALEADRAELEAKVAEANRARETALSPEVLESLPRCAGISLSGLSGLQRPREGEVGGPKVVAYVKPFDGWQRFVPIVGTLTVDAVIAGPAGEASPITVTATLGPAEVREAYRTAITGYYYLAEVPVDAGALPSEGTVTIRARFVDAISGLSHDAEAVSRIP